MWKTSMITCAKFCSVGFPERKREQFATFKSAHLLMKHEAMRWAQTGISSVFFFWGECNWVNLITPFTMKKYRTLFRVDIGKKYRTLTCETITSTKWACYPRTSPSTLVLHANDYKINKITYRQILAYPWQYASYSSRWTGLTGSLSTFPYIQVLVCDINQHPWKSCVKILKRVVYQQNFSLFTTLSTRRMFYIS